MKKYLLPLACCLVCGIILIGCGRTAPEDTSETPSATPVADDPNSATSPPEPEIPDEITPPSLDGIDINKIVKLGKYKGIILEENITPITDEELAIAINEFLINTPIEDSDGIVNNGDIVNIDYEGKYNGVPYINGSDQNFDLTIGSRTFIADLEDGLIGAKKGETLDIPVTFPDDYTSESMAGKEIIFTVTVNDIKKQISELTDEWVKANSDFQTVDEYKEDLRKNLFDYRKQLDEDNLLSRAWDKLIADSEITEYPDSLLEYGLKLYNQNLLVSAGYTWPSIEDYIANNNITQEQYDVDSKKSAKKVAEQVLLVRAIVQKEGISENDAIYKETLKQIMSEMDVTSEKLALQYSTANIQQTVYVRLVGEMLLDNSVITKVKN